MPHQLESRQRSRRITSVHAVAARAHRKYLVVILRPSSTGVFCPTACFTIQLPCVTRGMILNALWRRTVVAASPPASSRNLAQHQGFNPHPATWG